MTQMRPVRAEDKEMLLRWRNMPEVGRYMFNDHQISPEEHDRWFQSITKSDPQVHWIIVCDSEDVGLANLYDIDRKNSRCYWSFYIASHLRGKGIGSFAEYFVLNYVFEELGLNKLCGEVLAFNQSVLNMHKGFGFVQEGRLRQQVFKGGKPEDVVCVGMLREEWKARKPEIEQRLKQKGVI